MVSVLTSGASGLQGLIPARGEEKFWCQNTLCLVPFAGLTLDKCASLQIRTVTGRPLCRESHPLCRLKNPTVIDVATLATQSVQSTHMDNAREGVRQYIEKEKERK